MLSEYLRLIKVQHALFGMPFTLASMLYAASGMPDINVLVLVFVCFFTARGFGMTINRIVDRNLDSKNPRTSHRLLASGKMSMKKAVVLVLLQAVVFVSCAWLLNPLSFYLSPLCLGLMILYPYAKRFTWCSHTILGMVLACGPAGGWIAITGGFHWFPILVGAGVMFWTQGFDILYSLQDMEHDKKNGLYSVPACFGEKFSLRFIPVLHLMAFLCWLMASRTNVTGELYLWGLLGVAIVLVYEHYLIYMQGKSAVGKAFFPLNSVVSCLFLLVCCLQIFVSFPAL